MSFFKVQNWNVDLEIKNIIIIMKIILVFATFKDAIVYDEEVVYKLCKQCDLSDFYEDR